MERREGKGIDLDQIYYGLDIINGTILTMSFGSLLRLLSLSSLLIFYLPNLANEE